MLTINAKELNQVKRQLRHQNSMKISSNCKLFSHRLDGLSSEEDDLNVDNLLNTSNYIYLEEHHKLESYQKNTHRLKKFQSSADLGSGSGVVNNFSSANTNFDSD